MMDPFFDELSDGICVTDGHGKIEYLNAAAERLLDAAGPSAAGKTLCELLCGHLAVGGAMECASDCELRRPGTACRGVTFRGRYGPKTVSEWKGFSVRSRSVTKELRVRCLKSPPDLLGVGRHVTIIEDVSGEAEAARRKEDWREMIAHDLRTPLTSVFVTLRLAQEAAGRPLPADFAPLVDISVRACRKILELLELYLDVAKLDSGVVEPRREPVLVAPLARKVAEEQLALAQEKHENVAVDAPADLAAAADEKLLARVLQNLLGNALKFTPPGGRIEVSARRDGAAVLLAVKDTGPGIAPEDLSRIFDRYQQAQARRSGKLQGTGLGLTFCREALALMGGSIEVESALGKGTTFRVRLPAAVAAAKEAACRE